MAFVGGAWLALVAPRAVAAQSPGACTTDRTVSTLVGAGLGLAAAAIPATVVHRHNPTSSHHIVELSVSGGALLGFFAAGRDHPWASHAESAPVEGQRDVLAGRSTHAGKGAIIGAAIGGVVGALGGSLYDGGRTLDHCRVTHTRISLMLLTAGEGAAAGGLLGGLIGWAVPAGRR